MEAARTVTVGEFEITTLWDGTLQAELDSVLRIDQDAAQNHIAVAAAQTGLDPLVLPVRAFLLRCGDWLALIDTGSGTKKGPTMGHLQRSLEAVGVSPQSIAFVLLTHCHMDHIGGLTDETGAAVFRHAALYLHELDAAYFLDTPIDQLDARSQRNAALQRAIMAAYGGRLRRVTEGEGLDGVSVNLAGGHTPGHSCWVVRSNGQSLSVFGDTVHLAAVQLPRPDAAMVYDIDAERAVASRRRVLGAAADAQMPVAGAHLPAPGVGKIERANDGFRFLPFA